AAEVVAVREAARQDDAVRAAERAVLVPERHRLVAHHALGGAQRVPVVVGAGEDDHPPAHQRRSSASSTRKSSITPLASSRSHISRTRAEAVAEAASSSRSSMYLPTFTSCTSPKPRAWSELCTALPWGSRMPRFGVMKTRASRPGILGGSPGDRAGCGERSGGARREPRGQMAARSSLLRRPTPGARPARRTSSVVAALPALAPRLVRLARHDHPERLLGRRAADAPCRLLIGVFDAAEVAPEAVLVELLARPLVPEAAGVGADLVGEQDLAVVAAELELHVDQHDGALVEVLAQERVDAQRRPVDGREVLRRGEPEEADVPVVDHRVVERVVLVEVLEDGLGAR